MSDNKKVFKDQPTQRLINWGLPDLGVLDSKTPQVPFVRQLPGFGWSQCTPTDAGRKMNEWVDGHRKFNLIQQIAHAKRWVEQQVTDMITCYLPVWLRHPLLVVKVALLLKY